MVGITEISAVIASLNAAKDITSAMVGLRDADLIGGKVRELNTKIIEAQLAIFDVNQERSTLIEAIRDLKEEILRLKAWDTEKQRYELQQIASDVLAYKRKAGMQPAEPPHYICSKCYEDHQKSILQVETRAPIAKVFVCHRCGSELYASGMRHAAHSGSGLKKR